MALFATYVHYWEGSWWSPFELLYGWKLWLARDKSTLYASSISTPSEAELTSCLQDLTLKCKEAQLREQAYMAQDKWTFDEQIIQPNKTTSIYKPGDLILLHNN